MLIWAIVLFVIGAFILLVDIYIEGFGVLGVIAILVIAASLFTPNFLSLPARLCLL